jgi:hypothetical protein
VLQASHCSLHAEPQQTPSTQNPLAHSALVAHVAPTGWFCTQTPAWQCWSAVQSPGAVHPPSHWVAPHVRGVHACVSATGQAPAPLQKAGRVAVLVVLSQLAALHWTVESGYVQSA